MIQRILTLALAALLTACGSTASYNPTVFAYEFDEAGLQGKPIKTVVLAHINLGGPSRSYLQEHEPRLDKLVTDYLVKNGYKVLPQREFEQRWKTAERIYGDPIDPTSGKMNQKTFVQILVDVRDSLAKDTAVDAIVFTDLLEVEVPFSGGLQHVARWHGVSRKPTLQGPGEGVSMDFDWNKAAKAASLWVSIYDMELQRMFTSIGGLDTTEAIDTRSASGRFVRRRSMLENQRNLEEGIELAFHPFIEMKSYPGQSGS